MNQAKYLGVMLHKNLKWKPHVDMIYKKANNTQNFLQRNLLGRSRSTKVKAYRTYVKPIINYASTVWNLVGYGNKKLRDQIEMVQRKSARFVFADWQWQAIPTNMMKKLNWSSLESDQNRSYLLMIHKIIHNCIALPVSMLPKWSQNINTIQFQLIHGRVNAYENSFVPATIEMWNNLPNEVVNEPTYSNFKSKLEKLV